MKKMLFLLASLFISNAFSQNIPVKDVGNTLTTCIDGITYFVGVSFDGKYGFKKLFISSVKIDPKTMQPQLCKP